MVIDIDKYLDNAQKRYQDYANQILRTYTGITFDGKVFHYHKMVIDFTTIVIIFISTEWLELLEEQIPNHFWENSFRDNWYKEYEFFIKNLQRDFQLLEQKIPENSYIDSKGEKVILGAHPRLFNLKKSLSTSKKIYASDYNFFVVGDSDNGMSIFLQLTDE